MKPTKLIAGSLLLCMLASCGGQQNGSVDNQSGSELQAPGSLLQSHNPIVNDATIPTDSLLPWEELNADGFVDPATARMSSAINENSEFWRGVDAFQTAGTTSTFGQALNVTSGSAGGFERSSATYRIPLAGENPATLSTDINLYLRDDGAASDFYIGIANYATGRWDFFGGFTDGRIRLPLSDAAAGDYISGLGNAFISIVAHNGSEFDIVGVSLNQFDVGDINAPPVPGGLTLSPVAGGLELQWNSVVAADLAGYRIHWSKNSFISAGAAGVQTLNYLEGSTRHVLSGLAGTVFVAISAVDLNGNSSAISTVESAAAGAGTAPQIELAVDSADGLVGSLIQLSALGTESYDWDLDGDGVFEVVADITGNQFADTGKAGIIRPAVRASSGGGTAVALGAVSLIIAQDLPPVAILTANRTSGVIISGDTNPLNVNFSAANSYDDGGSLDYAWSLLGDGNWTLFGPADALSQGYSDWGIFNATVRVKDNADQEAYALLPITVRQVTGFRQSQVVEGPAGLTGGSLAIVDGHPAIVTRRFNGPGIDGMFYSRALDREGRAWGEPVPVSIFPNLGDYFDLTVISGNPAIAFYDPLNGLVKYIRATSSTGQTLADWSNPPVTLAGPVGIDPDPHLEYVAGNPAVIWQETGNLWYRRATSASGTGDFAGDWADPALQIVGTGFVDDRPDFAVIDGNPAVAYRDVSLNEVHYLRSTSTTGASALDWPAAPVVVNGPNPADGRVNLAEVNGAPAVSFHEGGAASALRYVRANSSTGELLADWPLSLTIADLWSPGANYHDLTVVGGRPAVAFEYTQFGAHTYYCRASNASGSAWGELLRVAPIDAPFDNVTKMWELTDMGGFPAITAHHSSWDRTMFYTYETEL